MALNRKLINPSWLFGIGAVCLLCGLGAAYIENHFSKLTIFISLAGLVSILICFFELKKFTRGSKRAFQWQRYGFIVLAAASLLTFLAGVNYLAYHYNTRWDITKAKQHTLTRSTTSIIKDIKQEVKVIAFHVGIPPKYLDDLFKEYERQSKGKIKTEIIDPIVRIGYAAQFGSVISGEERKVIIISGSERRDIDFTEQLLSEEQLTNAIMRVARDKRVVYFLTGHGEYDVFSEDDNGLSLLREILSANNIETKTVMLGIKNEIPDDCNILIVAGPRNPLTEEEDEIIKGYLKKGGDALFLIENTPLTSPDKPLTDEEKRKNPSLNNILEYWGVRIADDIVVDLSNHIGKDVGCPATRNYPPHKTIVKNLDYTFYIRPRSISVLDDRRESVRVAPLVLTASKESSWGETNRTLHVQFDEGVDRPGPVPIAVVIWEPRGEGKVSDVPVPLEAQADTDTRIIVFTDADFLSNAFLDKYSNAEMGLNAISWLSDLDYRISIDRKTIKIGQLDLTSKQKRIVAVTLFAMPLLIAASGIITWLKRKS